MKDVNRGIYKRVLWGSDHFYNLLTIFIIIFIVGVFPVPNYENTMYIF